MASKKKPSFETSPERVAIIRDTLNAVFDVGGITALDAFSDAEALRALAERLHVPFLQLELMRPGSDRLAEADVDEYTAWRAALDRKAGVR